MRTKEGSLDQFLLFPVKWGRDAHWLLVVDKDKLLLLYRIPNKSCVLEEKDGAKHKENYNIEIAYRKLRGVVKKKDDRA